MSLSVHDYANRRRDPGWELELARTLRSISEQERLEFIQEWILCQPSLALLFAHKCLQRRRSFYAILQYGLDHANASSISAYLDCVVPRVGFRRAIAYLSKELPRNPKAVGKALYWLPRLLSKDDERGKEALRELQRLATGFPDAQRRPLMVKDPKDPGGVLFRPVPD